LTVYEIIIGKNMAKANIKGSWIDIVHPCPRDGVYWNRKTLAYSRDDWRVLVEHLKKDIGLELLIVQNIFKDCMSAYPSKLCKDQWYTANCQDPLLAIIEACFEFDIKLYMGIGIFSGDSDSGHIRNSKESLEWHRQISEEVLEKYAHIPSFCGWYMASEMTIIDGVFSDEHIEFTRDLTDCWKELKPDRPSLASPYFCGGKQFIKKDKTTVQHIRDTGLSVIAYQNGVGLTTANNLPNTKPENNVKLFQDLKWCHEQTDVALWANTELFSFENNIFFQPLIPAPFERIKAQIEFAAPHVKNIIAYTVPGLMTSQRTCPDLGAPETEELYQSYIKWQNDKNI
jgi:hypothetical protein